MQTHARACADADVRRCTRARVGGRRCRHRRETRARAQRTRARTRGRKPRCMRATQMQTHPRARADADADALTRRCRRRFGRTCIDRDGVRFPLNAVNRAANNAIGGKNIVFERFGCPTGGPSWNRDYLQWGAGRFQARSTFCDWMFVRLAYFGYAPHPSAMPLAT